MSEPSGESGTEPKAFVHRLRVGWADCDAAQIAYTGRFPYFALEAIDAWWEHQIGFDWFRLLLDRNIATPFVNLQIDFRVPVTPRFPLDCAVRLAKLGRSSVTFRVFGMQNGSLAFQGSFVCVFVDSTSFEKITRPADIESAIAPLVDPRTDTPNG